MKWIYCGIAGCIVLCLLIFHSVIFTQFAAWTLQAYTISHLGKPLQYDQIAIEGGQLVLVHPRFESDSFKAERLAIGFHLNPWKRQLFIDLDIEKPHWNFQSSLSSHWDSWAKFLARESAWLKIYPQIRLQEGTVSWSLNELHQHRLKFDLEMNHQTGGIVSLFFDTSEFPQEALVLQTLKIGKDVKLQCLCKKIQCASLLAFAQFLGLDLSSWLITSGFLQGELTANFPGMHRPFLEGDLNVENLVVQQINSALQGKVGKAHFHFEKNQMAEDFNHQVPTTIGKLEFLEPASLIYQSSDQPWLIDEIKGSVHLNELETAVIALQGRGGSVHHPVEWILEGKANLNAHRAFNLDAFLFCSSGEQIPGKIHLLLTQLQEESKKQAKIHCENLSYVDCGFLQTLLAARWPAFNSIIIQDGEFNALIEADIMDDGLGELYVKNFEASHLRSKLKPLNMTCDFGQVRGYGKVQLGSVNFWQTLNTVLHLEDGQMEFDDVHPPLPLKDIQAHLLIQKGCVEHSLVTLQLAGLKGTMDVEWNDQKQLLTFKLDGIVEDLAELFPSILQEGLRKHFYHNRLIVLTNLKRPDKHIEFDGTLHVQRSHTDEMDVIHFGCELKKVQDLSKSKYAPVGWFHAQKLSLEKFLSPFIFRNGNLLMTGEAEFKGSFDDQSLLIKYDAHQLKIENEKLRLDIPLAHPTVPGELMGSHQVDLHTYAYQGMLPLHSATYFEKNTGLIFHDIQGLATFKNDFVRISPIEAYCQGVYFNGELELEYSDPAPGVFDVMIHCPAFSGKISQFQHLLAYLEQSSLLHRIPLEGEVCGKGKGLSLKFGFVPDDYQLQAEVQGALSEGALAFEDADMSLRGIDLDISYNHQTQLLACTDIQGTLLVGKPRRVEEYVFTGSRIHLQSLTQPNLDVDIAIKDQGDELLRVVAHTEDESEGVKKLILDNALSHLSCIYPQKWQCRLKDWSNIEQFEFHSQFELQRLLQDLQRFKQTGFLFLSHGVIDKISQFLPLTGKGSLNLSYQPDQSYSYSFEGKHIRNGQASEHYALLKGCKQDKKWIIDQLQWDDWNASAELHQTPEKWRIPFLGLKVGQALLLGMEGDWLQEQAFLQAKLKFCELDLSQLEQFESLKPFMTKWWPKGILNATGDLKWDLLTLKPLEGCKLALSAEVRNLSLRDCPVELSDSFLMRLQPHHYFGLEKVCSVWPHAQSQAYINLKTFEYDLADEGIHALAVMFQIPHPQLEEMGEKFHHHFPDILEESIKDLLILSKQESALEGTLSLNKDRSGQNLLRLELEDGLYVFKKREYNLQKILLQVHGEEMRFSALSQCERCPFQVKGEVKWPACQEGQCQFTNIGSSQPLVIQWENRPDQGMSLRSVQGEFNGCTFFLKEDKSLVLNRDWLALQGQVTIDFNHLSSLLTLQMAKVIQNLKIGFPYSFKGNFWLKKDGTASFLDSFSFKGQLLGQDVVLKGYQLENVQADVQYVPGRLDVQNLSIQDPAVTIKTDTCIVTRDPQEEWNFFNPHLTVKNLRLNLLRDQEVGEEANTKYRSLILKRIECHDLQGRLDQIQTWRGEGNLHFMNPSRKHSIHPIHTLFAIPAEIILRLGLDPHVLNPVTGTIDFNLKEGLFYLTRFKDVYSEGRGSKFYLAQESEPSWMDWEGNLSVNVRMKQYNLIFKIAELFTVSIKGNIKKPQYSLLKHSKPSRKPQAMSLIKKI